MKECPPEKVSLIKKSLATSIAILSTTALATAIFSASAFALSPLPFPVWTVEDGKLLDPNGNPFIFRGVTIDHSLAPEKTVQALRDLAALGANSAQIEFPIKSSGDVPFPRPVANELREIVKACKDNKLVCVLEANDAAGYFEVEGGLGPDVVAQYWGYYDIRDVLNGAQGHIVLGISNQPLAPIFGFEGYIDRMQYAISEIRHAYPYFLVMVDGSNWGQDTNKAMHTLAAQNLQSSLYQNVIYSVEMFDQYVNPEQVREYIASFSEVGAPLVIGGFGPVPYYHPHFKGPLPLNAPRLPAESVMQYAEQYGAGYFGWSWSGNKNSALDVVIDWNPGALSAWGNTLFNDVNGIKATAKQASIYSSNSSGSSSSSSSSSVASNNSPTAVIDNTSVEFVRCGEVYGKASALRSTDPDGDSLAYKWTVGGPAIYTSTEPEIRFPMFWPFVDYTVSLEVKDGKGGVSTSSTALRHSYSNACPPPQSSSSTSKSSSSRSSSSISRSSGSSISKSISSSSRSSSSVPAQGNCSYVINSQWGNGFTAAIRIKNTTAQTINGWSVNWQYADGSKVTGSWNATLTGANPYNAKNLSWNANIQPGQTVEFGFQGSKPNGAAIVPIVSGAICQ
ncbi:MAG: man5B [Cellvibrio sp.]|jgi:mannan endo-1,4-beta-mannosidase|nr:man5B [Cellvibrio sp.]